MSAWIRFWDQFEISTLRLRALRVALYGILGLDLWMLMIEHAPRYGAGGFNVPQFRALAFLPVPSAEAVGVAWLVAGFAALRLVLGVAVRQSAVLCALGYAGVYFWSQADNYQHHYLVSLMTLAATFVPWERTVRAPDEAEPRVAHWAVRLLYVQVAILYFWAAVAKMDPLWLDGSTMEYFTRGGEARANVAWLAGKLGVEVPTLLVGAAWSVMLGELFAAAVFLVPRLWWLGVLVIPWFHVGVEWLDFKIEWFSYYMIALNLVMLCPDRVLGWLGRRLAALRARLHALLVRDSVDPGTRLALGLAVASVSAYVVLDAPVEGSRQLAIAIAGIVLAAHIWPDPGTPQRPITAAVVHLGLASGLLLTLTGTDVAYDYYRQWGGDLRRRGEIELAIDRYEKANALTDGPARFDQLGDLYARTGRPDDALAAYEESLRRQRVGLAAETEAARRDPARPELQFDVGDRHVRIGERCRKLARSLRKQGDAPRAETYARCALTSASDARDAFKRGLERAPRSSRGRSGLQRAAKLR